MGKWKDTSNHWSKTKKRKRVLNKVTKNLKHNYWKGKKRDKKTKEKISKTKTGVSIGAGRKCPWMVGNKNKNWKGGISDEMSKIRRSIKYRIWAKSVYERDNYTCRLCLNKDKKSIVAHHLKLFSEFPELRFDIDNGIALCRSCHKKIHCDVGINTRFKKI